MVLDNADVVGHDFVVRRPLVFAEGCISSAEDGELRLDLRGHCVIPGLVNAHDHLQLNAIPPLRHARPFANSYAWIEAMERHRESQEVVAAVAIPRETRLRHGGLKNLLAGTTTVAHHDPWHDVLDDPGFPVSVVRRFGWSHSLGLSDSPQGEPTRYGPPVQASFGATPRDQPWIIHLAEGTDHVARGELARLESLGCLAENTVIVHGTGLTAADIELVLECRAGVVWCPTSNLGMLGRTLDPERLIAAGRVVLGTDSRLTGSRDLLDELRAAQSHTSVSPRTLLRTVTVDAAHVLRLPHCAQLVAGQPADCLILSSPGDPYESLLTTTRSSIRAVVRAGAPAIADPDFVEWFDFLRIPVERVRLDGRPKLMAKHLARPEVLALEPGIERA